MTNPHLKKHIYLIKTNYNKNICELFGFRLIIFKFKVECLTNKCNLHMLTNLIKIIPKDKNVKHKKYRLGIKELIGLINF